MTEQIPTGLRHVLEIVRLVRRSAMRRTVAVKHIAKMNRRNPESVMSACTRGIGISAEELDDLLAHNAAPEFCEHLVRRFPQQQPYIEKFFGELIGQQQASADDFAGCLRTLFPNERRELLSKLVVYEAEQSLSRWLGRDDLPAAVRDEMQVLQEKVKSALQ